MGDCEEINIKKDSKNLKLDYHGFLKNWWFNNMLRISFVYTYYKVKTEKSQQKPLNTCIYLVYTK